jgi:hypothetical protein
MSKKNINYEIFKKYIRIYFDSVIAISFIMLSIFNSVIHGTAFLTLTIITCLTGLIVIDLFFNSKLLIKIVKIDSLTEISRNSAEYFIKAVFYVFIIIQILVNPLEVSTSFIVPYVAALDYYFFLFILLLAGLYYSSKTVFKSSKKNELQMEF